MVTVKVFTGYGWIVEKLTKGCTIRELLSMLIEKYGQIYNLIDKEGRVMADFVILKNGLTVVNADEVINEGDVIYILQTHAGG